jgi:L-lactate dehydrogenase complex protein LldG
LDQRPGPAARTRAELPRVVAGAIVSDAREEILRRVRAALRDVPSGDDPAVPRDYRRSGSADAGERLDLLEDRLRDYRAAVRRIGANEVATAVLESCREQGLNRVAVPPGLPESWRPPEVEVIVDEGLDATELDRIDGVVTGCACAIAQTGTIILDGEGPSGRRALTLVPDHHICVVAAEQVVELVPEGFARVAASVSERRLPLTLISGPSASSDIELTRVEGVHGPRQLVVLLVQ